MKKNLEVKKVSLIESLSFKIFVIFAALLPQLAFSASFNSGNVKNEIFNKSGVVANAITFVFWLLAFIEIIDFLSNLSSSGFFLKILRPAFMILFAAKWTDIVAWFI